MGGFVGSVKVSEISGVSGTEASSTGCSVSDLGPWSSGDGGVESSCPEG